MGWVSALTVGRWKRWYAELGLAALEERKRGVPRTQVPPRVRGRVIALTRMPPPMEAGLSHLVGRCLAAYLRQSEGVGVLALYRPRVVGEEPSAAPLGHVQDLQGSGFRGEGGRCRRAVTGPAQWCRGPLGGRGDAGPGSGSHPARPAGHVRRDGEAHRRLRSPRHPEPLRRLERRHV
ncbi:helix-turn-helix domain-containing protein [Streptomyces sp. 8K308]|nr:helix-turn-helix domain-containing protein [Streptomyces sp. 8K308]